ncbi:MAG: hypothetical protein RLZZ308_111 [Candidatus Parcubacteria bacterium]|jgi:hypothetical protein
MNTLAVTTQELTELETHLDDKHYFDHLARKIVGNYTYSKILTMHTAPVSTKKVLEEIKNIVTKR